MAIVKTYFSHDVNSLSDPKIAIMIKLHGVISYAWWWMILEKLAEAPEYKLPCNRFTYLGLSITMDMRPETVVFSETLASAKQNVANLANATNANLLEMFINSLVEDCNLLETDGQFFWSPGLIKRAEAVQSKKTDISEKRRQAGRLGGLAKSKLAKQNVASAKQNVASAKQNVANQLNKIKVNEIKDIEEEEETRARDQSKSVVENPNKKIYDLYLKSIGIVSPVIKERLDDLVETHGLERVIVAINTTADNGGNSIGYVERVANDMLRKEVQKDLGEGKSRQASRGNTSAKRKTDGSDTDWSKVEAKL